MVDIIKEMQEISKVGTVRIHNEVRVVLNQDPITEVIGVAPIGLEKAGNILGKPIYVSNRLTERYLLAIKEQKLSKPIYHELSELTYSGKIVPCYTTGNLIKYLAYKLFGSELVKQHMAFFDSDTNKVYILFDNRVKFAMWTSDASLSAVTLHELQHYAAYNLKSRFFNINKRFLGKFYQYFFNRSLNTTMDTRTGEMIAKFLFIEAETPTNFKWMPFFIKYGKLMKEKVAKGDIRLEDQINEILEVAQYYFTDQDSFLQILKARRDPHWTYYENFFKTYQTFGYNKVHSMFGQEYIFPSEIISITSEWARSEHYAVVKLLNTAL